MARYIFIDRYSSYIWGDSANIGGKIVTGTPCEVAEALDKSVGEVQYKHYWETRKSDADATYDVYRVDIDGSEQVGIIGQNEELIDAVKRDCEYVTSIARSERPEFYPLNKEIGSAASLPAEVRSAEVRRDEVCLPEARRLEIRPAEVRVAEVRTPELHPDELRLAEVRQGV